MRATALALALAVTLSACATSQGMGANFTPIIDTKDVDMAKAGQDTTECQAYANQVMSAGQGAAAGALAGAIVGTLLAAAVGASRNDGAALGAVMGGTRGAVDAEGGQRGIISRCMAGRGYRVLN